MSLEVLLRPDHIPAVICELVEGYGLTQRGHETDRVVRARDIEGEDEAFGSWDGFCGQVGRHRSYPRMGRHSSIRPPALQTRLTALRPPPGAR